MLVFCLLLAAMLLVFVLGMLSSASPQVEASAKFKYSEQARALAQAGLEDCRAKLFKDLRFPPPPPPGERVFSYSETLLGVDDVPVGQYNLELDQSLDRAPYFVIKIRSTGTIVPQANPLAVESVYQEIDTCPYNRTDEALPNLDRFKAITVQESR